MPLTLAFLAGLALGLLLNWRSWKALNALTEVCSSQKRTIETQQRTVESYRATVLTMGETQDVLWQRAASRRH